MTQIPDAPLPDGFPMGIAANGQFIRRWNGQRHRFGCVRLGWRAALQRFKTEWRFLETGQVPPGWQETHEVSDADHVRWHETANRFWTPS